MFAQLGEIEFKNVLGFDKMTRDSGVSIVEHARINNRPQIERTGSDLDKWSLSIRLHRQFCSPEEIRAKLFQSMESGEIMPFISGTGRVYGDFVIQNITQEFGQFAPEGQIIFCDLNISMMEHWDDDREDREKQNGINDAFAREGNVPEKIESLQPTPFEGRKASDAVLAINADSAMAISSIEESQANPSAVAELFADASRRIKRAQEKTQDLQQVVSDSTQEIQAIQDAAIGYQTAANDITNALDTQDQQGVASRLIVFRGALGTMNTSSSQYQSTLAKRGI